jgi:histidyl-tRNA synthetase
MFQPVRGTRDFLPDEMRKRNWVIDNIRRVFREYAYEPLGTPAFESWEMLKIKSGEDIINQIYFFKDKSNRDLGLRFEWTSSLARVIASHRELPLPFKRYAIGPVWRYERPSERSRREFWQMDADIVGVNDPVADTEILSVAVDCLRSIGLKDFLIKINDRRLLESFVKVLNLPSEKSLEIFRAIDKIGKIGNEAVVGELEKIGISHGDSIKLIDLISIKGEPEKVIEIVSKKIEDSFRIDAASENLLKIVDYSNDFGIKPFLSLDLGLARGLDYYTGPIFEVFSQQFFEYGSVAGGGRYDELVQLYGGDPTPMTGISMGIDRIVPLLEKTGTFKKLKLGLDAFVVCASKKLFTKAVQFAQNLRRAGVSTEIDLLKRGMRKQLDIANKRKAQKAIIVGEKELKEECVSVRNMLTSEQNKVKINNLVNYLKNSGN